jgi:hypothetical protein
MAGILGTLLLLAVASVASAAEQADTTAQAPAEPRSVAVPFTLDHNRMIVDVEFVRPDGTIRTARAWVDTGNQFLMVGEALARDLGLEVLRPKEGAAQYPQMWASGTPELHIGGMPLDMQGVKTEVLSGASLMPGVPAEANVPASALSRDHVVFDYPARRLTLARPGVLRPRGVAIPCRVNAETGLFQIAATLDGESVQLGVDNGSSGTWVADTLTTAWRSRHPDWPHATGAVGSANFFGFDFEAAGVLMRLPDLGLGPLRMRDVGLLGLDQSLFAWYSKKSAGAVIGFIGANVLTRFRLEVDYPNRTTYWEAAPPPDQGDLDIVGLTLRPEANGGFTVAGVATRDGRPAVEGVQSGDTLVRVGALDAAGAPMGTVVDALRGKPGVTRTLVIERAGKRSTVEAKVTHFP